MSIQENIRTLNELNKEISRLSKIINNLRKQAKIVNEEITNYIIAHEEVGIKYNNQAFIVDKKVHLSAKPKKTKEESYLDVIQQYGIDNPREFLQELLSAGKVEKEITKLKVKEF